jgi:hypothetical protein
MAAAPVSDTVNERIPVSRLELEAHWQVDCSAAWVELEQLAAATGQCAPEDRLRRTLQLCAFIYQPPGGEVDAACPDFAAALDLLGAGPAPDSCGSLANFLSGKGRCLPSPAPAD